MSGYVSQIDIVSDKDKLALATVYGAVYGESGEEMMNARLMAAAPELLAVARRAVAGCACHATMREDIPCLSCMAREAIKKAERGGE